MATRSFRVHRAEEKADLVLRNKFDIEQALRLLAGGWKAFICPITDKVDPRLRISHFDSGKKHYPRNLVELNVLMEGRA